MMLFSEKMRLDISSRQLIIIFKPSLKQNGKLKYKLLSATILLGTLMFKSLF